LDGITLGIKVEMVAAKNAIVRDLDK